MFRSWKHNSDILPKLQTQLQTLLEAYGKFQPVVYDTQRIDDDGSDVVLRYGAEDSDMDFELITFRSSHSTISQKSAGGTSKHFTGYQEAAVAIVIANGYVGGCEFPKAEQNKTNTTQLERQLPDPMAKPNPRPDSDFDGSLRRSFSGFQKKIRKSFIPRATSL